MTRAAMMTLLAISLSACSGLGGAGGAPITHPAGDGLVLRVEQRGGLVPQPLRLTALPSWTLVGDGRVITPGPVIAIYPGPLLPNLGVVRLSEKGVQQVLRQVAATNLFDRDRRLDGGANVADAPETVVTLHADGREVTVTAYALGINPETGDRRALAALLERLTTLEQWMPADGWTAKQSSAYSPAAYRLLVRTADTDKGDGGIAVNLAPWPTASDPLTGSELVPGWRCSLATGADARRWSAALRAANSLTRFEAAGHRYQVAPRPLLPDEPATCG